VIVSGPEEPLVHTYMSALPSSLKDLGCDSSLFGVPQNTLPSSSRLWSCSSSVSLSSGLFSLKIAV
jgi:hypothetical protein